ncbi:MAG: protein translocase subunit SecD [Deltaproteobacteria bacterium]|nr:protein translocase subunit SecD [Deltaproteobacteria bacterium]MCB9487436.1 protein translocase subunit SecD [Deltaproteobacteria bacterium]
MRKNLTPRVILVVGTLVLSLIYLLPNFLGKDEIDLGVTKLDSISLGLDLKGGMHVVLRVMTDKAIEDELARDAKRIEDVLKERNAPITLAKPVPPNAVELTFITPQAQQQGRSYLSENWTRYKVEATGDNTLRLSMDQSQTSYLRNEAVQQARETIVNRVDEFAVKEPEIYTQGSDQIVVRLPGVLDPAKAKELIGRTALLEFKLVEGNKYFARTREQLLDNFGGKIPHGYAVYPTAESERQLSGFYMLRDVAEITGNQLTDARRSTDQYSRPAVSFELSSDAGDIFAELTGNNIGKQLAIVLDDKIMSAPRLQSRIRTSGQITGDFTPDEARDLARILRAGSLPVPVQIEEERTVGPTLGDDSIRKGFISFVIGGVAVLVFMVFYYKKAGLIANLALVANILMIAGGLAMFGATLTLPGIAGIILTVGMAVDANVIINERIREELRVGKTPRTAVESGYDKALSAVLDANITTAIASLVLYQFGTGPIRGFAVTLLIGLISSVFTAVIGTRLIYDLILQRNRDLKTLSI